MVGRELPAGKSMMKAKHERAEGEDQSQRAWSSGLERECKAEGSGEGMSTHWPVLGACLEFWQEFALTFINRN